MVPIGVEFGLSRGALIYKCIETGFDISSGSSAHPEIVPLVLTSSSLPTGFLFEVVAGLGTTVIVICFVVVVFVPIAVRVYVVVSRGDTVFDVCPVTVPTPLLIESDVSFVVDQERVVDCPWVKVRIDAENV